MSIPYIVATSFPNDPDVNRVRFSNGLIARAHGIDTWDHIRLAFRISALNLGANVTGTPRFVFGFCHGQTNVPGDLTADNFVGCRTSQVALVFWAGPPTNLEAGQCDFFQQVGGTPVDHTGHFNNLVIPDAAAECRTAVMMDLVRDGGGLFTLKPKLSRISHIALTDADFATYLDQAIVTDPALTDHQTNPGTNFQFTIDEGLNGAIDSVCFSWDRALPYVDVSDVLVARLA